MSDTPDFYIDGGVGPHDLLKTRRACWNMEKIEARDGTNIQLVRIDPPISEEPQLPAECARDVIGLFQQIKMSVLTEGGAVPMPSGQADFWVIAYIEELTIPLGCIGTVQVSAA